MKKISLCILICLLSACASKPPQREPTERPSPASPANVPNDTGSSPEPIQKAETLPPAPTPDEVPPSTGKGGYYLDDGPQESPPQGLDNIPDAIPLDEPVNPRLGRPYTAFGKTYTPMKQYVPYKEFGVASWYGKRFHGRKTASGEVYDMNKMTAAHPVLPIPSYVRVTNLKNQRSVVVRVNDRGPFHKERLIDLSYAAAYKLGYVQTGSAEVEVEAINPQEAARNRIDQTSKVKTNPAGELANSNPQNAKSGAYYVQVAAIKSETSANQVKEKLISLVAFGREQVANWYNGGLYKVRVGPYATRAEAENAVSRIKDALGTLSMIVQHR